MGKLGLSSKLSTPKSSPAVASGHVDSKISRQHSTPAGLGKAVAAAVLAGPVEEPARRPARTASAQIVVRSSEKFRRAVKRWALDENTSTQELIVTALRELYQRRGLGELPE